MKVRCGSHRTTNFLQLRTWRHGTFAKWELTLWALWGIVLIQIDLWKSHLLWRSHYWANPFEYIRVWLNPRSLPCWEFPAFNIPGFTCSGISSFQCTCYTWLGISSFQYTWVPIQGISNLQYTWFTWIGIPSLRYTCFPGQCKSTQIRFVGLLSAGQTLVVSTSHINYNVLFWFVFRWFLCVYYTGVY